MEQRDVFEILPTGFGKSLIFQAPSPNIRLARGFTICSPNVFFFRPRWEPVCRLDLDVMS